MAMPRRPPRHHNLNSSAGLSTAASALILSADRPFAGGRPNWPPLEARSFAPHLPRTAAGRTPTYRLPIRQSVADSGGGPGGAVLLKEPGCAGRSGLSPRGLDEPFLDARNGPVFR